uniref:Uncharacterized protein n=1 Tax=Populus trichocarpa TaxID=3694 RepID=A0A2K1R436_POPTR
MDSTHERIVHINFSKKTYQQKDRSRHGNKAWECEIISCRTEINNSILADGGLSSSSNTSINWGKSLNFTQTWKA